MMRCARCSGVVELPCVSAGKAAGGLDALFFAHMEEIDLCWRIRNRGYALKVQPASVVYHLGGGSLPMNHPRKLFLNYRNNLLMLYKNLSPREWKSKSRKRRVLDFMAWVMFLVKGEWANARSVGRAYREFGKMKKGYISATIIPKQDPCFLFQACSFFFTTLEINLCLADLSKC